MKTFDQAYRKLVQDILNEPSRIGKNRKGETLYESFGSTLMFYNPYDCVAYTRNPSKKYFAGEVDWYLSGSDSLEKAKELSKFWEKCSDDGLTVNSNYGKLLLHDRNKKGFTQFEYAFIALMNNIDSKKAVMHISSPENAYISNDNPCTMYLNFFVNTNNQLCCQVYMRSSDVWFGLPYDVPFFCCIHHALKECLNHYGNLGLSLGSFSLHASNVHIYDRNKKQILDALVNNYNSDSSTQDGSDWEQLVKDCMQKVSKFCIALVEHNMPYIATNNRNNVGNLPKTTLAPIYTPEAPIIGEISPECTPKILETVAVSCAKVCLDFTEFVKDLSEEFQPVFELLEKIMNNQRMKLAWEASESSQCLKKKCGALLVDKEGNHIATGFGGRHGVVCETCARDEKNSKGEMINKFYGDGCWSVHAEMRAIMSVKDKDLSGSTMYVTHGPCDACMKLMDFVGVSKVVYDVPYKTNYAHFPNIQVEQLSKK